MFFDFINALNKLYRDDPFIIDIFASISIFFENLYTFLLEVKNQFFFDKLTLLLEDYEKWLAIKIKDTQTTADRCANVEARWKSKGHNSIELIQSVANSWNRGETKIEFINGKLRVEFINSYGIPADLETLKEAIDDVKPAHLGVEYKFKYLLKKDIHNVLTKAQMRLIKKSAFARGSE